MNKYMNLEARYADLTHEVQHIQANLTAARQEASDGYDMELNSAFFIIVRLSSCISATIDKSSLQNHLVHITVLCQQQFW